MLFCSHLILRREELKFHIVVVVKKMKVKREKERGVEFGREKEEGREDL